MRIVKIALCDDHHESILLYSEWLTKLCKKHRIQASVSYFSSGESLFSHLTETPERVDILFMDILMGGINGMNTAQKLRASGCKAQIIFLTSYDEYVFDAFDVNAVQYLLKAETSLAKFEKVFLKALALVDEQAGELFGLSGTPPRI